MGTQYTPREVRKLKDLLLSYRGNGGDHSMPHLARQFNAWLVLHQRPQRPEEGILQKLRKLQNEHAKPLQHDVSKHSITFPGGSVTVHQEADGSWVVYAFVAQDYAKVVDCTAQRRHQRTQELDVNGLWAVDIRIKEVS